MTPPLLIHIIYKRTWIAPFHYTCWSVWKKRSFLHEFVIFLCRYMNDTNTTLGHTLVLLYDIDVTDSLHSTKYFPCACLMLNNNYVHLPNLIFFRKCFRFGFFNVGACISRRSGLSGQVRYQVSPAVDLAFHAFFFRNNLLLAILLAQLWHLCNGGVVSWYLVQIC